MMTKEEHIEFWKSNSEKDLNTSENMYLNGIYDWALFVGHLALEKILKALWIKENKELIPPKIHNLMKLSEQSNIITTEAQMEFFRMVNQFHLETRYQEYKDDFSKIANKEFTYENFQKIKEMHSWLKSLI